MGPGLGSGLGSGLGLVRLHLRHGMADEYVVPARVLDVHAGEILRRKPQLAPH